MCWIFGAIPAHFALRLLLCSPSLKSKKDFANPQSLQSPNMTVCLLSDYNSLAKAANSSVETSFSETLIFAFTSATTFSSKSFS